MRTPLIQCPSCGEATPHHRVGRSQYSPSALVLFGGPALALIFECSRRPQFRCERCGGIIGKHTITSRCFQAFWIWFLISILVGIALLLAGYHVR